MKDDDFPSEQAEDKARMAAGGLVPLEEYGVPVLHLHQRPLLHQLLLELQTLLRRSSSGSPRTLSLSPCPRFLQENQDTALITEKPTQPPLVNEVVQSNFFFRRPTRKQESKWGK